MTLQLENKSVLVIGLGLSGRSAANYLLKQGSQVWALDDRLSTLQPLPEIQMLLAQGLKLLNSDLEPCQSHYDLVIVSPGVPKDHPWYFAAIQKKLLIMGEAELAFCQLAQLKCKCIGITGTNGKTTVTLLIEHLLRKAGIPVRAVGNVGVPLTELLLDPQVFLPGMIVVAELSSFQLETMQSAIFEIAILLNITEDHLDRYASMQEYALSKIRLFDCVKPGGISYIEENCRDKYETLLHENALRSYGYGINSDIHTDLKGIFFNQKQECLLPDFYYGQKSHDVENTLIAYAVARECEVAPSEIIQALISFKKPPHRLEFVREFNGITFVDDSKATNVDAVVRAIESISNPIVLIAGGVDKGGAYTPWQAPFAARVRFVCTIGQAAEKIKKELNSIVPIYHFETLDDAVIYAAKNASSQETVLLSPGCSSYDMFSSYVHRGECFKAIVHDLAI